MGGSKATKEQRSGFDVVHDCFTEGGDSVVYRRLLPGAVTSEAASRVTSFFDRSRMYVAARGTYKSRNGKRGNGKRRNEEMKK